MLPRVSAAEPDQPPYHLPQLKRLAEIMRDRYLHREEPGPVVLFVLGAAASFRSGMPSWHSIKEELVSAAERCFTPGVFVEEAWNQLAPYLGPPPSREKRERLLASAKTEQILGVACTSEIVRDAVLEVLHAHYRKCRRPVLGEAPQLGYELTAHFLRHGFIDHVVNFNFDEALDVALDNELGINGYRRILTETDVLVDDEFEPPPSARHLPHYLKLHGTISIPSSLRFTKDHTQSLSPSVLRLLDKIAFPPGRKLHLVTLGYSWNDPDFVNWVVARTRLIERVTIIRGREEAPPALYATRYAEHRKMAKEARLGRDIDPYDDRELPTFVDTLAIAPLCIHPHLETAVDDILWALANGIQDQLRKGFADPEGVRKISPVDYVPMARHVILGHLFGPQDQRNETPWELVPLNKHRPELRLRLELWLHLFKCKGMMTLSGIADTPRIHRYRDAAENAATRPLDNLGEFVPLQVRETLFHKSRGAIEACGRLFADDGFNFSSHAVCVPQFDVEQATLTPVPTDSRRFISDLVNEIWIGDETEVTTTCDPRAQWLFGRPHGLTSYLALRRQTDELLKKTWTHLFVIAESGEWLARWYGAHKEAPVLPGQQIFLIRVSDLGLKEWGAWKSIKKRNEKEFRDRKLSVHEMELPWWRHNRHLTLAASIEGGVGHFHQGIYFRRRLKTSRIRPVSLKEGDCFELFLVFLAYAVRSLPPTSPAFLPELVSFLPRVKHLVGSDDQSRRFDRLLKELGG
jgi:hypothetical protein